MLERILSLLKRETQLTVTPAATGPFYTGWAMEAYPEMGASEMQAIVRRQKEQGCNVVWIGHNNPGVVDQHKVEPGLSYAVYRTYTDSTHPHLNQAQATFAADTYIFFTLTDDGVRLWVDGQLVIDDWSEHQATHSRADVPLSAGQHDIKMEYYEKTGLALAKLWWVRQDRVETFRGEYFNNTTLSGSPALVRDDEVIDFNWGAGSPAPEISSDQFSVRWTGKRTFEAGTYRFHALTDDGVRVWVDGWLIIDQWHDHPPSHYQAEMHLSAAQHDIKVEYYERGDGAVAKFWWGRVA